MNSGQCGLTCWAIRNTWSSSAVTSPTRVSGCEGVCVWGDFQVMNSAHETSHFSVEHYVHNDTHIRTSDLHPPTTHTHTYACRHTHTKHKCTHVFCCLTTKFLYLWWWCQWVSQRTTSYKDQYRQESTFTVRLKSANMASCQSSMAQTWQACWLTVHSQTYQWTPNMTRVIRFVCTIN